MAAVVPDLPTGAQEETPVTPVAREDPAIREETAEDRTIQEEAPLRGEILDRPEVTETPGILAAVEGATLHLLLIQVTAGPQAALLAQRGKKARTISLIAYLRYWRMTGETGNLYQSSPFHPCLRQLRLRTGSLR